jgi:hypothetical protein
MATKAVVVEEALRHTARRRQTRQGAVKTGGKAVPHRAAGLRRWSRARTRRGAASAFDEEKGAAPLRWRTRAYPTAKPAIAEQDAERRSREERLRAERGREKRKAEEDARKTADELASAEQEAARRRKHPMRSPGSPRRRLKTTKEEVGSRRSAASWFRHACPKKAEGERRRGKLTVTRAVR